MTRPRHRSRRGRQPGVTAVEALVAVPLVLFIGLGALQFAFVLHAKQALNFAVTEAARAGSVAHADPAAIDRGLARGLTPYLYGASTSGELAANTARAFGHVQLARVQGWLRLEVLSPTTASFDDWAEPARSPDGALIPGRIEIPNDSLWVRATLSRPSTGTIGSRGGEPIGRASGQTLADANLLKVQMLYGVPLTVPVVGRLVAWALRAWDGCEIGSARQYGTLRLPAPGLSSAPRPWACTFYGFGAAGVPTPRIPVRVAATIRMQTPARR